jgi:DNA-binding CsgD family transcriptional regulator/catechol 2,3-dioxygenase-like lactoylglutathione lyase family enzyme
MTSRDRGRPPHPDLLTPAEWTVAECVRHGQTNPAIAKRLGISLDAVKYHVANALQKLGFESRAELRRWNGVRRDSHLYTQETDPMPDMTLGPLAQIARTVKDIAAARRWYGEVLGLPHLYSFGNLAFYDCGGVRLYLSEGDSHACESILYFRVPDIRAAHAALESRGVNFINAPHMVHRHADGVEEWMAEFHDEEGRPLAIMTQVAGA